MNKFLLLIQHILIIVAIIIRLGKNPQTIVKLPEENKPDKSSKASHMLETGLTIMFQETNVLAKTSQYYARLHRKSIEIHKHENNFNNK